jgi:hypothetical protein
VPLTILETSLAARQVAGLRGPARRAYEAFLDDLTDRGCAALGYRVTGPDPLSHLCVKHLRGRDRVVVAFETTERAWVLLVGPHDPDPGLNVYDALYALAGTRPPQAEKRTKPPCCQEATGAPPVAGDEVIDDLVRRAKAFTSSRLPRQVRRR